MGILDLISGPYPGAEAQPGERRRSARVAVALSGALSLDGEEIEVSVLDLSGGGVRVDTSALLAVGERFVLHVDGWPPTPVAVRWTREGKAGLAFVG